MKEKRQSPRKPVAIPLVFEVVETQRRTVAACRDLSLGGMFIETSDQAAFGAEITIILYLPGMDGEQTLPATVRWTTADGMGVQFGLLGVRHTHALKALHS